VDYTREELIYFPRNPLSWRVYGLSPMEQIIIIVNIVIRRQLHLLQYYTEGNLPDSLLEVPEGWSVEQIREWQQYWDSLFAGNTAQRRRGTWVPKGMVPHETKAAALKDPIDEWFARVVCYCFSLSPQPFVQQINRATAETAQETALQEGLAPVMEWVLDGVNECLERGGYDLVEAAWKEEIADKPKEQAEIHEIHQRSSIKRRSEIRQELGLEDDGVPDFVLTAAGPVLLDDIGKTPPQPEESLPGTSAPTAEIPPGPPLPKGGENPAEKLAKTTGGTLKKAKPQLQPIDRERSEMVQARAALKKLMFSALQIDMAAAAEQLGEALGLAKAEESQENKINRLLRELELAGIAATREEAARILAKAAQNGGYAAFSQIGFYSRTIGREFDELAAAGLLTADELAIVNQVNKLAVEWAENRAAELVTKITESSRDYLRADITQAVEEGWSTRQLADQLQANFGFSESRSETIARTETAFADCNGNFMAYKASGVVSGKEWILGSEHDDYDECDLNAAAGVIPLDEAFPSGDQTPPAHPRCVCDFLPVLAEISDR
jgi:hypothetical protein